MATCKDCLQNCGDTILSDQCVVYTGPDIPLLGICQGMILSQFEAQIASNLISALDGTGITVESVTLNCTFLTDVLADKDKTLVNLLQLLLDGQCTLKSLVDTINKQLIDTNTIDVSCLTGLPANPTKDDILQAVILLLCSINETVSTLSSTYVKLSDLTNLVTQIVNNIIGGGSTSQQNTKMVPFAAYEYYGPLSNFDNTGKGITATGFDKVYLCNGANGTPDRRGRVAVGAIRNVPGGTLDPAVDPGVNPNNPNWGLNDKAGENFHLLTVAELAATTPDMIDPGHSHPILCSNHNDTTRGSGGGLSTISLGVDNLTPKLANGTIAQTATTGITFNPVGGNQPHNNIQPSIAANFIMYIP